MQLTLHLGIKAADAGTHWLLLYWFCSCLRVGMMSHLDSNLVTSHKLCCFLTFDLHGQSNNLISVPNFRAFLFIGSPRITYISLAVNPLSLKIFWGLGIFVGLPWCLWLKATEEKWPVGSNDLACQRYVFVFNKAFFCLCCYSKCAT